MMLQSHLIGVTFALSSAVVYGSADFSGGIASRRSHQFQVLAIASLASVLLMGTATMLGKELLPSFTSMFWAALAGISGALGIAVFYHALSLGNMAIVAPTAGVVGAILPVVFAIITKGFPGVFQMIGFVIACVGIWLVTRTPTEVRFTSQNVVMLAIVSGIGFGGFFILIAQVDSGAVFATLTVQKSASACIAMLLLLAKRIPFPTIQGNPLALLAGILDVGANALYLYAKEFTRLDVAAVLTSLYPAVTVFLACMLLKEKISRMQWGGVILCITAIGLIVL
jgi:drug/metabolite transporter (DMT)-like permease